VDTTGRTSMILAYGEPVRMIAEREQELCWLAQLAV
jgi:hypothetical protein